MKRIKGFIIFLYLFLTVLVLIVHPVMHKPFAFENTDFNLKEQLLNPQTRKVSDFYFKFKYTPVHKTVAQLPDSTIHISPDEPDKRISFETNTEHSTKETTVDIEDNTNEYHQDVNINVSDSDMNYQDRSIIISDQDVKQRERNVNLDNNVPQPDIGINIDSGSNNVKLKDSDEVGNRRFKGSREEIIAWNEWRSELQNRIMDESAIEAPVGTLILFSFDVSSSGHISNLKYTCSSLKYASEAKADMVSILKRLEGDEVLKFPPDTNRKNVRFKGGFMLDYNTVYSKPSDYSDYERVRL